SDAGSSQQVSSQQSGTQPVSVRSNSQSGGSAPSVSSAGQPAQHPVSKPKSESLPHRIAVPASPAVALAAAGLSLGSGPALVLLIVVAATGLLLMTAGTRRSPWMR